MISTSLPTCTGFVPESITSGSAAGQGSGIRYRSRLEMKRTLDLSNLRVSGGTRPDLRFEGNPGQPRATGGNERVVPNLYRRRRTSVVAIVAELLGMVLAAVAYGTLGGLVGEILDAHRYTNAGLYWPAGWGVLGALCLAGWASSISRRWAVTR